LIAQFRSVAMNSTRWKTIGVLLLFFFAGALATPANAKSKHGRKQAKHGKTHHAAKHRKPAHHS
jgi:hypothetical protein